MGVVRLKERGGQAEFRRGCTDGGQWTVVEFASRMMRHMAQLKLNPQNRIVMRCHSANLPAMTAGRDPDERPSTVPGDRCSISDAVRHQRNQQATAEKMRTTLPVSGAGTKDMDASFSLIETAERAAEIDMTIPSRHRECHLR